MERVKKLLLILIVCSCGVMVKAQDIHFSQFYLSPLTLNPALTGVMNWKARIAANYRNQWASILRSKAFNTYSVAYDQKFASGRYDYFGVGGTFWGDKAGTSEFSTLHGKLSLSYSKRMGGSGRYSSNYLVVGAEGGVSQRSIDFLKLQWGDQENPNNPGQFCQTCATAEQFDNDNFIFADLAAGILWFSVFDERSNFYLGAAYSHINRADVSFSEETLEEYFSKITLHTGGEFMLGDRFGLVPGAVVFLQGPSFQINGGTSFKFLLGDDRFNYQALHFGGWARVSNRLDDGQHIDAIILSARFDYNNFILGFSYDVNVSSLKPASNSNGAYEFAVMYTFEGRERRGVYCPNF